MTRTAILIAFLLGHLALVHGQRVAVLPFQDQTKFKGKWDLRRGVPKYLTQYLAEHMEVVGPDSAARTMRNRGWKSSDLDKVAILSELGSILGASYLISGKLTKFYVVKKMAGSGSLGGYKHYNAGVEARVRMHGVAEGKQVAHLPLSIHKRSVGMRINLPGKISADEENYHSMEERKFGSKPFRQTVIGEAMDEFCKQTQERFAKAIQSTKPLDTLAVAPKPSKVFEGKILTITDSIAYISLGEDDSIFVGEQFPVFGKGDPILDPTTGDTLDFTDRQVCQVQVTFIKSRHLCSALILGSRQAVAVGDRARVTRFARP